METRGTFKITEDFYIMKDKALIALGFIFVLSQTPLIAEAGTISVPGDVSDLRSALESAVPGDRVELSPGVYFEKNLVMPEGIALVGLGDLPGDVVIDAGFSGRILLCEGITQATYIENITFTQGRAEGPSSYDQSGGAIYASNSSLRISNCVFSKNEAGSHGGAIRSNKSSILIYDSVFVGNSAPNGGGGAVDCSYDSEPLFRNCDFNENSASWGGALSFRTYSAPLVSNCRFKSNSAEGELGFGGAVFTDLAAAPEFTFSTFHDNQATYGGALASFKGAETNLENCTIAGNIASISGGGLFCHDSSPRVTSSIFAFQEGSGIEAQGSSFPQISCTDVFGNTGGDWVGNAANQANNSDNLTADPNFCIQNPEKEGEFSIQDDSPCGETANPCGTIGAWPVGCSSVPARLMTFEADWGGDIALLSWQTISNGETPEFILTGALENASDVEWEIPYYEDGGGKFIGEDSQARANSGQRYVFRLYVLDNQGNASLMGEAKLLSVPEYPGIRDLKAWPNPFNPLTTISFSLGQAQQTRISIFTVDGRRVKVLESRRFEAGSQDVKWDGTDDSGRRMSTGAYLALVEGEHQMQTVKLMMVK
jgi:predicted outer membrane repeat protein